MNSGQKLNLTIKGELECGGELREINLLQRHILVDGVSMIGSPHSGRRASPYFLSQDVVSLHLQMRGFIRD